MAIKQLPDVEGDQQELPPPDPNNQARQKALTTALGGPDATALPAAGAGTTPLPAPAAQSLPAGAADPGNDPFASMGGGVYANGGWLPKDYPTGGGAAAAPAPGTPAAAAPAASDDPFASMGGGVQIPGGGWVPRDHPAAAAGITYAPPSAAATGPNGNANPGTIQGAYNNALQNLLTGKTPQEAGLDAANNPAVQAYRIQREHQEGKDRALLAERNAAGGFAGSGGAETGVLGLRQAASRDIGQYAGQQAQAAEAGRRQELLAAIATSQAMGDTASSQALQRELAQLRHSEIGDQLGFDIADRQQFYNQQALLALLSGGQGA